MNHYRAKVGPPWLYDVIGAQQFTLLTALGLREDHYLLDIGCGSLRAGRLLIPYLRPGHYYGIEPDQETLWAGLYQETGWDLVGVKEPTFDDEGEFRLTKFGRQFDYLLAQSIFTHACQRQVVRCLQEAQAVLSAGGIFLFSFKPGHQAYKADEWTSGVATYPQHMMKGWVERVGLVFRLLPWPHPNGLTWAVAEKGEVRVPDVGLVPPAVRGLLLEGV